jgi:3-hydroxybutyryl-CoA dehydratase
MTPPEVCVPAPMKPGDELSGPVIMVDPQPMKVFAALLRDPNMIHLDPAVTRELGMGDRVVNQGPFNLGYVHTLLERYGRVVASRFRFHGNVVAGDRVVAGARVTAVDGVLADLEVWLDRIGDEGARVVSGTTRVDVSGGP